MDDIIDTLFDFRGRNSRAQYALGILSMLGVFTFWMFLCVIIEFQVEGIFETAARIAMALGVFLLIWSNMAVTAKRLHDLNLTGWLQVPAWIISCLPFVIPFDWAPMLSWSVSLGTFAALAAFPSRDNSMNSSQAGWRNLPKMSFSRTSAPARGKSVPGGVVHNVRSAKVLGAEFDNRKLNLGADADDRVI